MENANIKKYILSNFQTMWLDKIKKILWFQYLYFALNLNLWTKNDVLPQCEYTESKNGKIENRILKNPLKMTSFFHPRKD